MKELYIAPELNVICFAPVERLANNDVDINDLINAGEDSTPASRDPEGDIDLDL